MSYYFVIVGTQDNPLFEYEFGTSKQGGDGLAHFGEQQKHMTQFIVHSSLDIVEEVQWTSGQMYLKCIDKFFNNYISCFITPSNAKFLLLHQPTSPTSSLPLGSTMTGSLAASTTLSVPPAPTARASTAIGANPTGLATEEAIRNFFTEVYENWVKAVMNPFYRADMEVTSPIFRQRVAAAGRKYL
ncbi:Trafficking protein particle complex subunit 2 [Scedosporium apiospermum]|uniref:Trafficking protein particle complex subunit 2 n=1 Tax=Pseudallescheria apiosperma TaxID=563466 RepID=A0A084G2J0_PSEDA|nr:Trafficking protein particle complex subunit 2 [Scedosporium apiospermum]KEZ41552.1 Trafficking protein particle complex subunit 2 [Scedosporium apiospermum]